MTTITEYKSDFINEKYYKIEHESGLDIYLYPKERSVLYALLSVNYGSAGSMYYSPQTGKIEKFPEGIAHFLEHKMFEDENGGDKSDRFNEIGAYANAYTSYSETAYTVECTKNAGTAIYELLKLVRTPHFTEESVAHEKYIIEQEINTADDDPYEAGYYAALHAMYKYHSIKKKIAGNSSSIKKITAEQLYLCHKLFYVPKNMKLGICGDIDCQTVIKAADEAMKGLSDSSAQPPKVYYPREYSPISKKQNSIYRPVSTPIFDIGIKITDKTVDKQKNRRTTVAMNILTSMLLSSSEPFCNLMYDKKLIVSSPQYEYVSYMEAGYSFVVFDGQSKKPETFYKQFILYLEKLKKKGLSHESFERTKRVYFAENIKSFDSCDYISSNLAFCAHNDFMLFDKAELIADITFDEVSNLFYEIFDEKYITLSVINSFRKIDKRRK